MGIISDAYKLLTRKKVLLFFRTGAIVDRSSVLRQLDRISLAKGVKINNYCVIKPHNGFVKIGSNAVVGEHCVFYGNGGIEIGDASIVAPGTMIMSAGHEYRDRGKLYVQQPTKDKGIRIGQNVWIGANATILDGVSIGDNSIIGAGSVVTKSIAANTLAFGCPAKEIKKI